jgi:phosphatidylserine/phosphatidylglycerophosphate/cardiolipin synthase-like enzyme
MNIKTEGEIHFSDPSFSFQHTSLSLEDGIKKLIKKAKNKIILVSFSLTSYNSNWYLHRVIDDKVKNGVKLVVFGNNHTEVRNLVSRFRHLGSLGYSWKRDESNGLFHIKAIIVDDLHIYFGSANLSENSIKNSAEMGFISSNTEICICLQNYLEHLIDIGRFELV